MAQSDEYKNERTISINGFDGGYNIADPPDLVGDTQMIDGSFNYLVENNGFIERRPGQQLFGKLATYPDVVEDSLNAP